MKISGKLAKEDIVSGATIYISLPLITPILERTGEPTSF
jgi:hypothetical protein